MTDEATTPVYYTINLKVPDVFSYQGLPLFLGQEMSVKCSYFPGGYLFTHSPLILQPKSLIILLCFMFCMCLFGQNF